MKRSPESFLALFSVPKPVLGMVHLGKLAGQDGFTSETEVIRAARADIRAWQRGGIHGLIFENWLEDAVTPFVPRPRRASMSRVIAALVSELTVPYGVNVLNNDYPAAFAVARDTGASFIQMDVTVDRVRSDFRFNEAAIAHPFTVDVSWPRVSKSARYYGVTGIPILGGIHPKHYLLLEPGKTIEQSATEASRRGIAGLVITKATGRAPLAERFEAVRRVVSTPLGIGSGLDPETAPALLPVADFAIVGTYAKKDGITDNPVDAVRVRHLMEVVTAVSGRV